MKDELSSRSRLLKTINHQEPDHVPLTFRDTALPTSYGKPWRDQFDAVDIFLNLGIDPLLQIIPDNMWQLNPDVRLKVRKKNTAGEQYAYLIQEYHTSKGTLRQVVRQTPDWPHGDEVPVRCDHVVPRSRSIEYLVSNKEELEAFSVLFKEPDERDIEIFEAKADLFKRFSEERGVLISGGGLRIGIGDFVAWICGLENAILWSFRNPELLHMLLDIILDWNLKYVRQILETGVAEVITCRGYYETADFWSPRIYKTFFAPRLRKLIETVHQGNAKFGYNMTTGIMPLLDIIKDLGVDIFLGPDPVEGGSNLQQVKERIGNTVCLWGGMNAPVTLGTGTPDQIENAVKKAIKTLAPGGGFILSVLDSIILGADPETCGLIPWENIEHMIETWHTVCRYPISIL